MAGSSVFKVTIDGEVAWWYGQACLLSFNGKLFTPYNGRWAEHIAEMGDCCTEYQTYEYHDFDTTLCISDMNGEPISMFFQHPYHTDEDGDEEDIFFMRFTDEMYGEDQLTPRALEIQRFLRRRILNKRKHLLGVLLAAVPVKNPDVAGLIAQWL